MSSTDETYLSNTSDNDETSIDFNDKTITASTTMNSTEILEELTKRRRGQRISFTHQNNSYKKDLGPDPSLPSIEELYKGLKSKYEILVTIQTEIYSIITEDTKLKSKISNHLTNCKTPWNKTQQESFSLTEKIELGEAASIPSSHWTERSLARLKIKDFCLPSFGGRSSEHFLDFISIFERTMSSNNFD